MEKQRTYFSFYYYNCRLLIRIIEYSIGILIALKTDERN
jgi:hypothetical protein